MLHLGRVLHKGPGVVCFNLLVINHCCGLNWRIVGVVDWAIFPGFSSLLGCSGCCPEWGKGGYSLGVAVRGALGCFSRGGSCSVAGVSRSQGVVVTCFHKCLLLFVEAFAFIISCAS